MRIARYILGFTLIVTLMSATNFEKSVEQEDGVQWITFEEALERNKQEPRKILVDFYTDWCGWCKRMDRDVYARNADCGVYKFQLLCC